MKNRLPSICNHDSICPQARPDMIDEGHFDRETRISETESNETAAPKAGWMATLIMAIQSKIPAGYEDDSGFHFGAESSHLG